MTDRIPMWLSMMCLFGDDGRGKVDHTFGLNVDVERVSLNIPRATPADVDRILNGLCFISNGGVELFVGTAGSIPVSSLRPGTYRLQQDQWPDSAGMKIEPGWRILKGQVVTLNMDGPKGLFAGVILYGHTLTEN
jgi:hypothetical protein